MYLTSVKYSVFFPLSINRRIIIKRIQVFYSFLPSSINNDLDFYDKLACVRTIFYVILINIYIYMNHSNLRTYIIKRKIYNKIKDVSYTVHNTYSVGGCFR